MAATRVWRSELSSASTRGERPRLGGHRGEAVGEHLDHAAQPDLALGVQGAPAREVVPPRFDERAAGPRHRLAVLRLRDLRPELVDLLLELPRHDIRLLHGDRLEEIEKLPDEGAEIGGSGPIDLPPAERCDEACHGCCSFLLLADGSLPGD